MPARIMYWNWMTPTTPVPQNPANYTPGYPNQYCLHPSSYSYPQANYYQTNYQQNSYQQQVDYGQVNYRQTNYQQTNYQQKMMISLPNPEIPTIVIDDDDDDDDDIAEVNKHDSSIGQSTKTDDLEVTKPKIQFPCYSQVKCEVPKDIEDWTELTVKEDPSTSEHAVKKENEREWIDWTELNVKEEIEESKIDKSASIEDPKIISEEDCIIINDSEKRTGLNQESIVVENLKEEPTSNEECIIIEDSEEYPKKVSTEEERHREHVIVEELEPVSRYPPTEQLKCDYCDYETEWRSCLSRHLTTKHKDLTPQSTNNEENNPITTKETADGKFHCPDCSYRTDWKSNLNKHIISRHTTSEKIQWYGCAHCPYKGKTKEYLRVHLISHGKLGQWHKCPHCTFKSKQRYVVNNHIIVTHTDDEKVKWYKCSHCLYKAKLLSNLKKHVANQHIEEDKINWFKCEHCHYKAKNRKGLRLHMLNRHTGHDEIQWHVCNKCGHKIKTRKNLVQHLKSCKGTGVSPPVKSETREVLVYMGDKLCFRRVPIDNRVNEKHRFCNCKHCKS